MANRSSDLEQLLDVAKESKTNSVVHKARDDQTERDNKRKEFGPTSRPPTKMARKVFDSLDCNIGIMYVSVPVHIFRCSFTLPRT
jgi:hypothetical protein